MRLSFPDWSLFGLPPLVSTFIAAIVGIHVTFSLLLLLSPLWGGAIYSVLMLNPQVAVEHGHLWQLFSYALVHDLSGPMHILFNTISLAVLGPPLEEMWGRKSLLRFTVATILGGGVAVCLAYVLGFAAAPVVGASAAALGMLVAFGITFPDRQLLLWGVLAVSGQQLITFAIAIEIIHIFFPMGISTAAHIGGMMTAAGMLLKPWRHWRRMLHVIFRRRDT